MKSLTQQSLLKGKESVPSSKSSSKLGILVFHMHNPTVNRPEAPLRNIMIYTTLVTHFLAVLLLVSCNPCHDERHLHHQGSLRQTTYMQEGLCFTRPVILTAISHQRGETEETTAHQDRQIPNFQTLRNSKIEDFRARFPHTNVTYIQVMFPQHAILYRIQRK